MIDELEPTPNLNAYEQSWVEKHSQNIPDYGEPKRFLPKWTADEIHKLNIEVEENGDKIREWPAKRIYEDAEIQGD